MYLQVTVVVVITFGLAVFVHEFGHMIFALLRGVGVESFAIGMGPKITEWKWRGIDFSLRWLPLGGFVKLQAHPPVTLDENQTLADGVTKLQSQAAAEGAAGEAATSGTGALNGAEPGKAMLAGEAQGDVKQAPAEKTISESSYDDLYALQDKGFLTKVLVFGGGVFMNYVTAILVITLMFLIGVKKDLFQLKVEAVKPETALAKTGVAPGDQIVAVNGQPVTYFSELDDAIAKEFKNAKAHTSEPDGTPKVHMTLTVERGGKKQILPPQDMTPAAYGDFTEALFGSLWRKPEVDSVMFNKAADKAGIKKGDLIVAVDGKPVESYNQMVELIAPRVNQPTAVRVKRGDKFIDTTVTPQPGMKALDEDVKRGYIGVTMNGASGQVKEREANPFMALYKAHTRANALIVNIVSMNARFFKHASFKDVRENVSGPIGIAAITAKIAQNGWEEALQWFVMLNLLLMIFNLLPLPVLDGGFILLAVIEGVIRRPVPAKVLAPIYTFFVVGFIILMVLISVQDLFNWIPQLFH